MPRIFPSCAATVTRSNLGWDISTSHWNCSHQCWSEPSEKAAYAPSASASLLGPASGKGVKLGKVWKEGPVGLLIIAMENPTIVAIVEVRQPHACVKVMHSHICVRVKQPRAHARAVSGAGCNENRLGMGEGHHTHRTGGVS